MTETEAHKPVREETKRGLRDRAVMRARLEARVGAVGAADAAARVEMLVRAVMTLETEEVRAKREVARVEMMRAARLGWAAKLVGWVGPGESRAPE